jgi:glycosyltransferase involved in cell wall biosynthesis
MRLTYVLLSPTFGLHQYTADLANRMAALGHAVQLVTSASYPADRYAPSVAVQTPVRTYNTGLGPSALRPRIVPALARIIQASEPDLVHITGPHLWNGGVIAALKDRGVPVVHSLHDLDPHRGALYGALLRVWNRRILAAADHILVHGQIYKQRLADMGWGADRVTYAPLLHLFLGYGHWSQREALAQDVKREPFGLFFGRLEAYKGIDHLISAWTMMSGPEAQRWKLVLAGSGSLEKVWAGALPTRVDLRNHLIDDEEALDLFRRCSLVLLPYTLATQSAVIAAAYYFRKPVIVSPSGALPEYVEEGRTGWIVPTQHAPSFARCLSAAVSDPDRLARMGEVGRAWYNTQRIQEEKTLLGMYARVVERGGDERRRRV